MKELQVVGFLGVFVVTVLAGGAFGVLALAITMGQLTTAGPIVAGLVVLVLLGVVAFGRLGAPRKGSTYW